MSVQMSYGLSLIHICGDVANARGNPENLKPVRTTDEAKKRGAAGGKKSGAA